LGGNGCVDQRGAQGELQNNHLKRTFEDGKTRQGKILG
jgi:hypothetical protein